VDVFYRRLALLIEALPTGVDAFCMISGKEEGSIKPKTKAMYIWLFGYDMIETVFLVSRKAIAYLASNKKI
jgi:nucleosome binding factor SPN SPT16 subunit